MCQVFNTVGCLNTIIQHLNQNGIYDFKTLPDIIDFQNDYLSIRSQVIIKHENLIEKERNELKLDITQLEELIDQRRSQTENELHEQITQLKHKLDLEKNSLSTNILQRIIKTFREWNYKKQIRDCEKSFASKVDSALSSLIEILQQKRLRHQFIYSHFDDAVRYSYNQQMSEIERKKRVIDEVSSFVAGAIGEMSVMNVLKKLPDAYFLINDFSVSFSKAIYNRQENDYIKSIQIDHIVISQAGVFLIETKNWSEASIQNQNLRSPVQQIKRTSFALFKLITTDITCNNLKLDSHQWGEKKIPMRNLIVLTHSKPNEEFQFVKVLTLPELLNYITYFKPVLSSIETQRVTDYLLTLNSQKIIYTD